MDEARKRRLEELGNQLGTFLHEVIQSEVSSERFLECRKKIADECGQALIGFVLTLTGTRLEMNVTFAPLEAVEKPEKTGERPSPSPDLVMTPEDKEFFGEMKIAFSKDDAAEIAETLLKDVAPGNIKKTEKTKRPGVEFPTAKDERTVEQIKNDINGAALGLDITSRNVVAKRMNKILPVDLDTPEPSKLGDNDTWSRWITRIIEYIISLGGTNQDKKDVLLSIELIIKSGHEGP